MRRWCWLRPEALAALGLSRISFDLTLPRLAPTLLDEAGFTGPARHLLLRALDRKDVASVRQHGGRPGRHAERIAAGRRAGRPGPGAGGVAGAAAALRPRCAAAWRTRCARSRPALPSLKLTVDPLEFRDLPYHTGVLHRRVRLGPARGAGPRRPLRLRRGRTGNRVDAVSRCGAARLRPRRACPPTGVRAGGAGPRGDAARGCVR